LDSSFLHLSLYDSAVSPYSAFMIFFLTVKVGCKQALII
jgi:hypothetical protein